MGFDPRSNSKEYIFTTVIIFLCIDLHSEKKLRLYYIYCMYINYNPIMGQLVLLIMWSISIS